MKNHMLVTFQQALINKPCESGELLSIADVGFIEEMPQEHYWWFTHPSYPGLYIVWPHARHIPPSIHSFEEG